MTGDRLSGLEAGYLCFERPGRPVHVGAVAVFEGAPLIGPGGHLRLDDLREHVAARLGAFPRMHARIVAGAGGVDRPHWEPAPGLDLAHHVTEIRLAVPGGTDALLRVAEDVHVLPLDRSRPPWDLHVVTGLEGGRVGLVERVHHALVDGLGGVGLAAALLDLDPIGTPIPPASASDDDPPRVAPGGPGPVVDLAGELIRGAMAGLRRTLSALGRPAASARSAAALAGALATLADGGLLAPRTAIDAPPGGRRRLAACRVPLAEVKAIGRTGGATVNDVVLAAVAAGLRALLVARGEPVPHDLVLKALVPVSERDPADAAALGNEVSAVFVPLPVGVGDPDARLAQVAAAMGRLKDRHGSTGVHAALQAADLLPMPLVRALVAGVDHQRFVNLVVTNVPGPPLPLYLLGARLLEAVPVVPLAANLSLGVAVLTYDGVLTLCVIGDAEAYPDLDVVVDGIDRALRGAAAPSPRRLP